jgi:hypothetical protein
MFFAVLPIEKKQGSSRNFLPGSKLRFDPYIPEPFNCAALNVN